MRQNAPKAVYQPDQAGVAADGSRQPESVQNREFMPILGAYMLIVGIKPRLLTGGGWF